MHWSRISGIAFFLYTVSFFGSELKVSLSAPSALLINAETGSILYSKNIDQKSYPASLTKIATALYVLEKVGSEGLDRIIKVSKEALIYESSFPYGKAPPYSLRKDGSMMGVREGELLSLKTVLYGLLLSSGNDAANLLAQVCSGSIEQFMIELNLFLRKHAIYQTQLLNPHGLHHDHHWTTAREIAMIARLAFQNPLFREIVGTTHLSTSSSRKAEYNLVQTNALMRAGSPYFYSKAIGIKTGYTEKAGYNLVAAATDQKRTLIGIVLNCSSNQQRYKEIIKLFDAAFAQPLTFRVLFEKEKNRFSRPLRGANRSLEAVLKKDLTLCYYPSEEPSFHAQIRWSIPSLSIREGTEVAWIQLISNKGEILEQLPLYASSDLSKKWWLSLADNIENYQHLIVAFCLLSQISLFFFHHFKKS